MSDTVYSVINLKNLNPRDRVKTEEDTVYSEVKISDPSRGQKVSSDNLKTENTGSSSLCCRWSTVFLWLLCLLLFISVIILGVYLMEVTPKQHSDDCSILVEERNQIQQLLNNITHLQEQYNRLQGNFSVTLTKMAYLQEQNNQLEQNFSITLENMTHLQEQNKQLQKMRNNLVFEKTQLQQQCSSMERKKEQLQKSYNALFSKLPLIQGYCHSIEKGRVCDPCPQGWEKHNSNCYYFSTSEMTWNESQTNCSKEAAHLVTVNSEEEQDFLSREGSSSYWIGLTDSAEEGVWRWVDGTDLQQKFWLYSEPDNKDLQSAGRRANCVINYSEGWRDEPCEEQHRWICETETLVPEPLHI